MLIGSPGCGKTLLASRLPSLLPDTEEAERCSWPRLPR
ncbi:hypothetical protein C7E12_19590 [Stenotrophomonas maltophilia]|nr:hypothetical protein C7E12_19590 [Stenotrophomonas maltophilia]